MRVVPVIPAYEPNRSLLEVVRGLREAGFGEIVVVDDGSSKVAAEIFAQVGLVPGCRLLRHSDNCGKGAALKTAFRYILERMPEAEAVITVDADGQHAVADCRQLADELAAAPESYCLGVRKFSLKSTPFRSWWGNRWTAMVFALLFRRWIGDTQTGLRAFRRDRLPLFLGVPGEGYEYEMACLARAVRKGIIISSVGIGTIYEAGNASSHFRPWRDTRRIFRAMFAAWRVHGGR